ncbi:hypothetical protein [Nostoc sp. CMAA1605]|uniref:hypothetical protein n=1 Tax=Nostoc sp. CMAA1605 TaxID=2055159 RepID=UPI001F3B9796|nr:hypothetical protein [Nostoc sp. CMAA1605]
MGIGDWGLGIGDWGQSRQGGQGRLYIQCPMPYALCPMPYAPCPMPYALCPYLNSSST